MTNILLAPFLLANSSCGTKTGILPSLYDGLGCTSGNTPTITSLSDIGIIVANVIRILIAISGSLAVLLIMVGAVFYITSMGEPARVKRAKEILVNTAIGLVIIIASYAIVTFIAGEF